MRLAFLDLETSGGMAVRDRIIEVALIIEDDGVEVERWQQLVNPGVRLSSFIVRYTGIDDDMLADAPPFAAVADALRSRLDGCVLVAHNARFDYAFLKNEYRRLGQRFAMPSLCTVKLSRTLFPGERHHNLDAVIARHQLPQVTRHRAMGDTAALQSFLVHLRGTLPAAALDAALSRAMSRPTLPPQLPPDVIDEIPTTPGVYRFYGGEGELLYVGKSINLHERVLSHFSGSPHSGRGQQMTAQIQHIDWTCCAGDLSAQLLELQQIRTLKPVFNRRSRGSDRVLTLHGAAGDDGYWRLSVCTIDDPRALENCFGLFRSERQMRDALSGLIARHRLCDRLCSLGPETADGPCFGRQIGRCQGACEQIEPASRYNARLQLALQPLKLRPWPWPGPIVITESDAFTGLQERHVVDAWCVLASVRDEAPLDDDVLDAPRCFSPDTYRLLVDSLLSAHRFKVTPWPPIRRAGGDV